MAKKLHFVFATSTPTKCNPEIDGLSTCEVEKEIDNLMLSPIQDKSKYSGSDIIHIKDVYRPEIVIDYTQDASTEESQYNCECNTILLHEKGITGVKIKDGKPNLADRNSTPDTFTEKSIEGNVLDLVPLSELESVTIRNTCSKNHPDNIFENLARNETSVCQTKYCFCVNDTQDYTIQLKDLEDNKESSGREQKHLPLKILDRNSFLIKESNCSQNDAKIDGRNRILGEISEEESEIKHYSKLNTIHEELEVQNVQNSEDNTICCCGPEQDTEKIDIVKYRAKCEYSGEVNMTMCLSDVEDQNKNLAEIKNEGLICAVCFEDKESVRTRDDIRFSDCSSVDQMDYMQNKLVAMVQLLKDKEEMVEICERSLSLEGERVSQLMARLDRLQEELDLKTDEIQSLRMQNHKNRKNSTHCLKPIKTDSYKVLHNNLSVMENLYRDYFFESVRQDEMIDLLRNSYLEIRLREGDYTEQVNLLKNMLYSQKQSFQQQGNWEQKYQESFCEETGQELKEILILLNKLQHILRDEFNMDLKCYENYLGEESKETENEKKLGLQQRIKELENVLLARDETIENLQHIVKEKKSELEQLIEDMTQLQNVNRNLSQQLEKQEEQLNVVKDELRCVSLERSESEKALTDKQKYADDQCRSVEGLKEKLKNIKAVTEYKTEELENLRTLCKNQDLLLRKLKSELCGAQLYLKENSVLRNELVNMRNQMLSWPKQFEDYEHRIEDLEVQLQAAWAHVRMSSSSNVLQSEYLQQEQELLETSSRGRALCAESRHIACDVREAVRQMHHHRKQLVSQVADLQHENRKLKQQLGTAPSSSPFPISPASSVSSHSHSHSHSPPLPHSPLSPASPSVSRERLQSTNHASCEGACDDICQEDLWKNKQQILMSKCLRRTGDCTQRVRHNNNVWKERLGRYHPQ